MQINNPDRPQSESTEMLAARLRLKRSFLLSLVVSLTLCAVIAIGALLLNQLNKTTWQILGTLASLGFHSGIAMACAAALERRRRPTFSVTALILFTVNFAVMMVCIWWPGLDDEDVGRSILTTLALVAYCILAIPCANLAQARRWQPLPYLGIVFCSLALLMVLACIWKDDLVDESFAKSTAVCAVIAFSFAHNCFLGRVPVMPALGWLFKLAIASLWMMAAVITYMIVGEEYDEDLLVRIAGAVGVLDSVATIALVIMTKVKQVEKIQGLESSAAQIKLFCPRCTIQQVVVAGASKCSGCGLKFRIEIEEPRCTKCGYLLWQLPERRCPECGTTF
ncbi:MAG: hypothetical protein JSV03_05485 [Planctomycetota bacterium]|nr:MAG: hypothetical protein JSV03_05485 [Planctomycetota bacterium]